MLAVTCEFYGSFTSEQRVKISSTRGLFFYVLTKYFNEEKLFEHESLEI